jgi:polyhydroxyalkanoate synthesis regulator protein
MQDFMSRYLETSVDAFMKQQDSLQKQVSQMLSSAPPPMNAMADLARQNMEMWSRMQESMLRMFAGSRGDEPGLPPSAEAEPDEEPPDGGDLPEAPKGTP